eukprot:2289605-Pleurochrysis_carterae.AAC.1
MTGALGSTIPDRWTGEQPSDAATTSLARLRVGVHTRVTEAASVGRTVTALEWFTDFLATTERTPFVDPGEPGGTRYNHETLALFAEFIWQCGSRQRSRTAGGHHRRFRVRG